MKTVLINEDDEIRSIIKQCNICFLGLAEMNGTPHVIPMNFGFQDGIIYLHSAPEGNLMTLVEQNNKVCITFCTDSKLVFQHPQVACSYRMKSQSVMAWGEVEFIENLAEKENALNILMAQYSDKAFTYSEPAVRNVKIWKIEPSKITCKAFAEPHKKH